MKDKTLPWFETRAKNLFIQADWMEEAACCYHPTPGIFFPERGQPVTEAKKVCSFDCPVWKKCLDHAVKTPEVFGIWGGLSERERRQVRKGSDVIKCKCGMIRLKNRECTFCPKKTNLPKLRG